MAVVSQILAAGVRGSADRHRAGTALITHTNPASWAGHVREGEGVERSRVPWVLGGRRGAGAPRALHVSTSPPAVRIQVCVSLTEDPPGVSCRQPASVGHAHRRRPRRAGGGRTSSPESRCRRSPCGGGAADRHRAGDRHMPQQPTPATAQQSTVRKCLPSDPRCGILPRGCGG